MPKPRLFCKMMQKLFLLVFPIALSSLS